MVQFTLPRNSKVEKGKAWNPPPAGAQEGRWREYRIYRFDPDTGENPRLDTYWVDMNDCGPKGLDALSKIVRQAITETANLCFHRVPLPPPYRLSSVRVKNSS